MAINFPSTGGQATDGSYTYTVAGITYSWNGSSWTAAGAGASATDRTLFSVNTNSAGSPSLSYTSGTGVFDYTPPDLTGYLTSESDPVYSAAPAAGITNTNITNWNAAYGWGDHSAGGYLTALLFNLWGVNFLMSTPAHIHLLIGGFAFGAVFMTTDPVTASQTNKGKIIYGLLVGFLQ